MKNRRAQVAELLMLGMSNKQIAAKLQMSVGGIKYHVGMILADCGASNRTQAVVRMAQPRG